MRYSKLLSVLCVVVALNLIWPDQPVQAEPIICWTGKLIVPDAGTSESYAGGSHFSFGWADEDNNMIYWGHWNSEKPDGQNVDEFTGGITLLSGVVLWDRLGFFLTPTIGAGKIGHEDVELATFMAGGAYVELSKTWKLWMAPNVSNVGDVTNYSVEAGLSLQR